MAEGGDSLKKDGLYKLSKRVAAMVKAGMSNIEMAKRLGLSKNTILSHRFNIRTKLKIRGKDIDLKSHLLTFSKI